MRYRVVRWHGEGASMFAVVDTAAPEAEQPAVVASYAYAPGAEDRARELNAEHAEWDRMADPPSEQGTIYR